MNIRFSLLLLIIVSINSIGVSQSWPIQQNDDPNHYYITHCEFGEIHPADPNHIPPYYPDHFHRAIDIDINGNIEVRPIESGEVILVGSSSVTVGTNNIAGEWMKEAKYLHIIPSVVLGQQVNENSTILGLSQVNNSHLHLQMKVWNGNQHVSVSPLNNNLGFELTLLAGHENIYPPQINDIIVESLNNQTNNVASGCTVIDSDNNNGVIKYPDINNGPYRKVHISDTEYGCNFSTGNEYNYPLEKLVVWGNIAFIVNARDKGVNSNPGPGTHSGQGLTVQRINYSYIDPNQYSGNYLASNFSNR